jgi:hypothetical protein
MDLTIVLTELLDSGVIEKGILIWVILETKTQQDKIDDLQRELVETREHLRDVLRMINANRRRDFKIIGDKDDNEEHY